MGGGLESRCVRCGWCRHQVQEHSLRVLENRVLTKMLGSKREETSEEWRRLHEQGSLCSVLLNK